MLSSRILPEDKRSDRLSHLFVNICLAAIVTDVLAAALTWWYGHTDLGLMLFLAAATLPIALVLLRVSSTTVASHYLIANVFAQAVILGANPEISCVILVALAAGVAMLTSGSRRGWPRFCCAVFMSPSWRRLPWPRRPPRWPR